MSALADAPPDLVVHAGRRGRVAVLRLRGADARDPDAAAARAAERALGLRPRWLVLDLSAVSAHEEVRSVVQALRHRVEVAGVRVAVAGAHRTVAGANPRPVYPTFATVPIALGTLGAL